MRYTGFLWGFAFLAMLHVAVLSHTVALKPLKRGEVNGGMHWRTRSLFRQQVPLLGWLGGSDYQWYSNISVGTPPQNLTVLWNTGFSDLVIPRNNCTTCGASHSTFDPSSSTSYSEAQYGDVFLSFLRSENSTPLATPELAHCNLVYDVVSIGDLAQANQALMLCDSYTPSLAAMPIDGIIGLAPYDRSSTGDRGFFWNLWETHQLKYPVFSLYLPAREEHGAEITLGDVDVTKYVGPITTLALDPEHYEEWGTWVHHFTAIHINGERLPRALSNASNKDTLPSFPGAAALLDTSAPFIQNVYINVTLPQAAFNLGEYPGQPGVCQAVFVHDAYADNFGPYWVLGSPLLKTYYTVWDGLNLEVGWAELAKALPFPHSP
ncbi:acid protease [Xylaria sp. CBS 124048]|nr:acid protease [Xylaria sp. CBS 124048]